MTTTRRLLLTVAVALAGALSTVSVDRADAAATQQELTNESQAALDKLYRDNPVAKDISRSAKAILVFPEIVKAGFVFGGAYGEGVLFDKGSQRRYYNSFTGSWGLQAGAQSYGYVVFLMTDKAVDYVNRTDGWEIGVGPTVVVVDAGAAKNLSTSTLKDDAYAFIFDQKGLMAGIALEGTKITQIRPPRR
jgi:lipid-binding SYLF domain-containing protein